MTDETALTYIKALTGCVVALPVISVLYATVAFQRDSLSLLVCALVMTVITTAFATAFCIGVYNVHQDAKMRSRRHHPTYFRLHR